MLILGRSLVERGDDVWIAASPGWADMIEFYGLGHVRCGVQTDPAGDSSALIASWNRDGRARLSRVLPGMRWWFRAMVADEADTVDRLPGDLDLVIGTATSQLSYHIAELLGVPYAFAFLSPVGRTSLYASPFVPQWWPMSPAMRRLSHRWPEQFQWRSVSGPVQRWRSEHGLGPIGAAGPVALSMYERRDVLALHGYGRGVVPHPCDLDGRQIVTGFWRDPTFAEPLPRYVTEFLDAGDPPVYVGFGSMSDRHAAETAEFVVDSLVRLRARAMIATGWGGIEPGALPDEIIEIGSAPHDLLFPRCVAVVHHGGAGSTGASLTAGVPTFAIPFFLDQHFWGRRIAELGAGPLPVRKSDLTRDKFTAAVAQCLYDDQLRDRARRLGAELRTENGLDRAAHAIDSYLEACAPALRS